MHTVKQLHKTFLLAYLVMNLCKVAENFLKIMSSQQKDLIHGTSGRQTISVSIVVNLAVFHSVLEGEYHGNKLTHSSEVLTVHRTSDIIQKQRCIG